MLFTTDCNLGNRYIMRGLLLLSNTSNDEYFRTIPTFGIGSTFIMQDNKPKLLVFQITFDKWDIFLYGRDNW